MKSLRLTFLLAMATALLAVGCGEDDSSVGSESAPYEVALPEGWSEATDDEKQQVAEQVGAVVDDATEGSELEGVAVTSLWGEELSDPAATNIIVIREPVPEGFDFDEFVDLSASNVDTFFGDAITSPVTEGEETEIAGEDYRTFEYEADLPGGVPPVKRVVFISRDDLAYTLTLNTQSEDLDESLSDLEEIAASWEWTD